MFCNVYFCVFFRGPLHNSFCLQLTVVVYSDAPLTPCILTRCQHISAMLHLEWSLLPWSSLILAFSSSSLCSVTLQVISASVICWNKVHMHAFTATILYDFLCPAFSGPFWSFTISLTAGSFAFHWKRPQNHLPLPLEENSFMIIRLQTYKI